MYIHVPGIKRTYSAINSMTSGLEKDFQHPWLSAGSRQILLYDYTPTHYYQSGSRPFNERFSASHSSFIWGCARHFATFQVHSAFTTENHGGGPATWHAEDRTFPRK